MDSRRYSRQVPLPGIGRDGQARIQRARILCVGVGGLGCPASLYLAAAGVGALGLIDPDVVDLSNLQRQVLFAESEIGLSKVEAAGRRLSALNSSVQLVLHPCALRAGNALSVFAGYDIIVDGTDNFATKFLINDAATRLGLPVVHGTLSQFEGRASVFWAKHGPCYRCLYPKPPRSLIQNCAEAGVLGGVAGVVGSIQAIEALKLAAAPGVAPGPLRTLLGKLLVVDTATMETSTFPVQKNSTCPVCSGPPEAIVLEDLPAACASSGVGEESEAVSPKELATRLADYTLVDVREPDEWSQGHLAGALNWPLSRLQHGEWPDFKVWVRPALLYCQAGVRSARALELLRPHAPPLRHLTGGLNAWSGALVPSTSA